MHVYVYVGAIPESTGEVSLASFGELASVCFLNRGTTARQPTVIVIDISSFAFAVGGRQQINI